MVTTPVLFDTCILIDYLRGVAPARTACDRHSDRAISIVTWMEVLAGIGAAAEDEIRRFLLNFHTLPLTSAIAERAVTIRRSRRIKLPDAIIQATAAENGRTLITRNTRHFPKGTAGTHIPYMV